MTQGQLIGDCEDITRLCGQLFVALCNLSLDTSDESITAAASQHGIKRDVVAELATLKEHALGYQYTAALLTTHANCRHLVGLLIPNKQAAALLATAGRRLPKKNVVVYGNMFGQSGDEETDDEDEPEWRRVTDRVVGDDRHQPTILLIDGTNMLPPNPYLVDYHLVHRWKAYKDFVEREVGLNLARQAASMPLAATVFYNRLVQLVFMHDCVGAVVRSGNSSLGVELKAVMTTADCGGAQLVVPKGDLLTADMRAYLKHVHRCTPPLYDLRPPNTIGGALGDVTLTPDTLVLSIPHLAAYDKRHTTLEEPCAWMVDMAPTLAKFTQLCQAQAKIGDTGWQLAPATEGTMPGKVAVYLFATTHPTTHIVYVRVVGTSEPQEEGGKAVITRPKDDNESASPAEALDIGCYVKAP